MEINRYRREKCEKNCHTVQGWEVRRVRGRVCSREVPGKAPLTR